VEKILAERLVVATLAAGGRYDGQIPSVEGLDLLLGMTQEEPMDPETAELRSLLGLPS
jgi:hypothetical protein